MKISDLDKCKKDAYILLDAGEVWDLKMSLEGNSAVYLKPVESEMQIGAKQYVNGLLKMKIQQLKDMKNEVDLLNDKNHYQKLDGQLIALVEFYNSLKWNDDKNSIFDKEKKEVKTIGEEVSSKIEEINEINKQNPKVSIGNKIYLNNHFTTLKMKFEYLMSMVE